MSYNRLGGRWNAGTKGWHMGPRCGFLSFDSRLVIVTCLRYSRYLLVDSELGQDCLAESLLVSRCI